MAAGEGSGGGGRVTAGYALLASTREGRRMKTRRGSCPREGTAVGTYTTCRYRREKTCRDEQGVWRGEEEWAGLQQQRREAVPGWALHSRGDASALSHLRQITSRAEALRCPE